MDMADMLDEITYRLVATAGSAAEARQRVAIVGHWAREQEARLARGRQVRVDHHRVVAEAVDAYQAGKPAA